MTITTFTPVGTVEGLTCQHCVSAVTEEVGAIPGVRKVRLDLHTARLELQADRAIEPTELHRAVADAGYGLIIDR